MTRRSVTAGWASLSLHSTTVSNLVPRLRRFFACGLADISAAVSSVWAATGAASDFRESAIVAGSAASALRALRTVGPPSWEDGSFVARCAVAAFITYTQSSWCQCGANLRLHIVVQYVRRAARVGGRARATGVCVWGPFHLSRNICQTSTYETRT